MIGAGLTEEAMTIAGGDAITLLDVVELYEITMIEEERAKPWYKDWDRHNGVAHYTSIVLGGKDNQNLRIVRGLGWRGEKNNCLKILLCNKTR